MSESRVRENRMHGSMRRREAITASRASACRAVLVASRRPYIAAVSPRLPNLRRTRLLARYSARCRSRRLPPRSGSQPHPMLVPAAVPQGHSDVLTMGYLRLLQFAQRASDARHRADAGSTVRSAARAGPLEPRYLVDAELELCSRDILLKVLD